MLLAASGTRTRRVGTPEPVTTLRSEEPLVHPARSHDNAVLLAPAGLGGGLRRTSGGSRPRTGRRVTTATAHGKVDRGMRWGGGYVMQERVAEPCVRGDACLRPRMPESSGLLV